MKQVSLKEVNDRLWNKEGFRFEESSEYVVESNPVTGKDIYCHRVIEVSVEELGIHNCQTESYEISQKIIDSAHLVLSEGERLAPTYEERRYWG